MCLLICLCNNIFPCTHHVPMTTTTTYNNTFPIHKKYRLNLLGNSLCHSKIPFKVKTWGWYIGRYSIRQDPRSLQCGRVLAWSSPSQVYHFQQLKIFPKAIANSFPHIEVILTQDINHHQHFINSTFQFLKTLHSS